MTRIIVLLMAISLSAIFATAASQDAQSADGQCTVRDRIQLGQAGYTKAETEGLCGQSAGQVPPGGHRGILAGGGQPGWVQWCVTPQGACSLNPATSGYYPIGAPCNCYMPWGFYGGVAQ